jgi:hypothetical protein
MPNISLEKDAHSAALHSYLSSWAFLGLKTILSRGTFVQEVLNKNNQVALCTLNTNVASDEGS